MDDTPRRVDRPDDAAGPRPDEIAGRGEVESARGYAGATGPVAGESFRSAPAAEQIRDRPGAEPPDRRTSEIRAEIEQTREEMSETIDAIQEKLRPRNIVSEATGRMRDAAGKRMRSMAQTAGDRAQEMMERTRGAAGDLPEGTRRNAIPIAVMCLGAAWILWNRRRPERGRRNDYDWQGRYGEGRAYGDWPGRTYEEDYGEYGVYGDYSDYGEIGYAYDEDYYGYHEEGWGSNVLRRLRDNPIPAVLTGAGLAWLAFSNGEKMRYGYRAYGEGPAWRQKDYAGGATGSEGEGVTARAKEAAGDLASKAQEATGALKSRAQEATGRLRSRARDYVGTSRRGMRQGGRRAQNQLQRLMHQNPLVAGAAAFVLGAAVGLLIPETERENALMGETRDTLIESAQERAQDLARTATDRVKDAAGNIMGDIANEAVTGQKSDA